ncbi:MAG: PQQ-dependent sugar dehydrogenase [Acidihalobacter sp.]|uniref:PQQ-dependent sugar dehydrogenase n=1 Tax=Acidihalobacter sp. TaxID=1872108 RepID=UPI00307D59B7
MHIFSTVLRSFLVLALCGGMAHAADTELRLPAGFHAEVVAEGLGPIRFIALAPDGRLYAKSRGNGLTAVRMHDGHAVQIERFGSGAGTGIAVRNGWLYYSSNTAVYRYRLVPGQLVPSGAPQLVAGGFPVQFQHSAKAFAFDGSGNLYVDVGAPSNASGQPDRARRARGIDPAPLLRRQGGIWRFPAGAVNQFQERGGERYATGLRNVLALAWQPVSRRLFAVQMGRDQLDTVAPQYYTTADNARLPAEEMFAITRGGDYGWPYTYYDPQRKARMLAPEFGGDGRKRATPGRYPDPVVAFPAHWAPMQMTFYTGTQFPAHYRDGAFIAFHGSWNRAPEPKAGYLVAFVPFDPKGMPTGRYEVFADGFAGRTVVHSPGQATYRPCGIAQGPDGALYVADSVRGRIWRITYRTP